MAKVKIEGTTLTLEDSICKSDKSLKDALSPHFPAVANATITRKTEGDETVITVTKKAGTKGYASVIEALAAAPETINPILELDALAAKAKPTRARLDDALLNMFEDEQAIARVTSALRESEPQSSRTRPAGF